MSGGTYRRTSTKDKLAKIKAVIDSIEENEPEFFEVEESKLITHNNIQEKIDDDSYKGDDYLARHSSDNVKTKLGMENILKTEESKAVPVMGADYRNRMIRYKKDMCIHFYFL